jgi:hypothetical protein
VLYVEPDKKNLAELLELVEEPLAGLEEERVRPARAALEAVMEEFR